MSVAEKLMRAASNPRAIIQFLKNARSTCSQYGEDQVFRLLLRPGKHGVYFDVGAHHPVVGSNTFNLNFRGWEGVTIDPNPAFAGLFKKYRPHNLHLTEAVSLTPGALDYFEYEQDVLNTLSAARAAELEGYGVKPLNIRKINSRPLIDIYRAHFDGRQIDLLNVDCEGLDLDVLKSLNLSAVRPTVILVEDFDRFRQFRDGCSNSALHDFLCQNAYRPVAQMAFSSIYVAQDWRDLFLKSQAFSIERVQDGILPDDSRAGACTQAAWSR